uniref:Glycosyl-hydrolase family 116 catalytic region domain-containing protein n=1 Tax=Chromera velia CCMP2878 TaxID=1169474 RepID=A0A0G4GHF9_9ALVE|eukprot:Cvel_21889.t1-p1 / transcript=Cvel_21889.t1 / gene=Cvel_21889 / organism=Chromera_velia_CCMP2878 / gene_product=Non-lysosomal glucosylceramidase, putative / transcript_product=Non-lysosomal glucosylceramidase, putative / location=Cvel_scaffold2094:11862-33457(+) / protein_length=1337 / sequence_SO=supercontig / SO=protein_coding / is_pseudo=false
MSQQQPSLELDEEELDPQLLKGFGDLRETIKPEATWRRRFDAIDPEVKEFVPTVGDAVSQLGLAWRLYWDVRKNKDMGCTPWIDPFFRASKPHANHGVPCGGLGCGSIGRGWKGNFNRWGLRPGLATETDVTANQFSTRIRLLSSKQTVAAVLTPDDDDDIIEASGAGCGGCRRQRRDLYHPAPQRWVRWTQVGPLAPSGPDGLNASTATETEVDETPLLKEKRLKENSPQSSTVAGSYRPKSPLAQQAARSPVRVVRKNQKKGGDGSPSSPVRPSSAGCCGGPPPVDSPYENQLQKTTYMARFPRSWTEYQDVFGTGIHLICEQLSPFLPNDYVDSCLPCAVFEWTCRNLGTEKAEVSLMFSWQNGFEWDSASGGGHVQRAFTGKHTGVGALLHHSLPSKKGNAERAAGRAEDRNSGRVASSAPDSSSSSSSKSSSKVHPNKIDDNQIPPYDPLTFAVALGRDEAVSPSFVLNFRCDGDGEEVWRSFHEHGVLSGDPSRLSIEDSIRKANKGEVLGAAVCGKVTLDPGETKKLRFTLSWDMPVARFALGHPWKKRYLKFFHPILWRSHQTDSANPLGCPQQPNIATPAPPQSPEPREGMEGMPPLAEVSEGGGSPSPMGSPMCGFESASPTEVASQPGGLSPVARPVAGAISFFMEGREKWQRFRGAGRRKTLRRKPSLVDHELIPSIECNPVQARSMPPAREGSSKEAIPMPPMSGKAGPSLPDTLSTVEVAARLCEYAFVKFEDWRESVVSWQDAVLSRKDLPNWYKSTLFNELYFLVEGGSLWTEGAPWWKVAKLNMEPWWMGLGDAEKRKRIARLHRKKKSLTGGDKSTASRDAAAAREARSGGLPGAVIPSHGPQEGGVHPATHGLARERSPDESYIGEGGDEMDAGLMDRLPKWGECEILAWEWHAEQSHSTAEVRRDIEREETERRIKAGVPATVFRAVPENRSISGSPPRPGGVSGDVDDEIQRRQSQERADEREMEEMSEHRVFARSSLTRVHIDECRRAKYSPASLGHFLYLEGLEYLMYNTYDVHFYASWALVCLFPRLDNEIHKDMAEAILSEDSEMRPCLFRLTHKAKRKDIGCVPHDLGGPGECPLVRANVYNLHHTGDWKDLPSKFILQVWRNYFVTGDEDFLATCWPAMKVVMIRVMRFVDKKHGLIVHGGWPDHTYDAWSCAGVSAYSGGLWCAALRAYIEASCVLNKEEHMVPNHDACVALLEKAEKNWVKMLWDEKKGYFLYDSMNNASVHADQLAGIWWLKASGLESANVPAEKIHRALQTMYGANVKNFKGGRWGAMNGMKKDLRSVDTQCMQSREVWTGVAYGLAATMLQQRGE